MDNSRMGVMGVGGVLSGKETEKIVDFFKRRGVHAYFFVVVGSAGTPPALFPSATQHIKSDNKHNIDHRLFKFWKVNMLIGCSS